MTTSTNTTSVSNPIYPNLSQELGIKKRHYNVSDDDPLNNVLNDPGLTPNELNSTIYKNDFKKFRESLSKDVSKYHSLETRYLKFYNGLTTIGWFLGALSFIL